MHELRVRLAAGLFDDPRQQPIVGVGVAPALSRLLLDGKLEQAPLEFVVRGRLAIDVVAEGFLEVWQARDVPKPTGAKSVSPMNGEDRSDIGPLARPVAVALDPRAAGLRRQ
jgi:hypothetical protein